MDFFFFIKFLVFMITSFIPYFFLEIPTKRSTQGNSCHIHDSWKRCYEAICNLLQPNCMHTSFKRGNSFRISELVLSPYFYSLHLSCCKLYNVYLCMSTDFGWFEIFWLIVSSWVSGEWDIEMMTAICRARWNMEQLFSTTEPSVHTWYLSFSTGKNIGSVFLHDVC